MANQSDDTELQGRFTALATALKDNEDKIVDELNAAQGSPVDIGSYYRPDVAKVTDAMRPSATLNSVLASL